MRLSASVLDWTDRIVLGSLGRLIWASHRLRHPCRESRMPEDDNRTRLPIDIIEKYISRDFRRLERIEDKGKSNVFAAGVGVGLLTAGMALYASDKPLAQLGAIAKYASIVIFAMAVIYFLVSAIMSLLGYGVGAVNCVDLHDEPPLCTEHDAKCALLDCLDRNRSVITRRANYLTVATNLLVNAIVTVAIFLLFMIAAIAL